MVDDRLRRAAIRWGLVALCVQLGLASEWVMTAFHDLRDLVATYGAGTLEDRMSQLKPAAFKFPWTAVYITLFALVSISIAGALFYFGIRAAREPDGPRTGE